MEDKKGNCIHFKDSNGYEEWYEYDEKGNKIKIENGGLKWQWKIK